MVDTEKIAQQVLAKPILDQNVAMIPAVPGASNEITYTVPQPTPPPSIKAKVRPAAPEPQSTTPFWSGLERDLAERLARHKQQEIARKRTKSPEKPPKEVDAEVVSEEERAEREPPAKPGFTIPTWMWLVGAAALILILFGRPLLALLSRGRAALPPAAGITQAPVAPIQPTKPKISPEAYAFFLTTGTWPDGSL